MEKRKKFTNEVTSHLDEHTTLSLILIAAKNQMLNYVRDETKKITMRQISLVSSR